jgi:protein phosphatase
MNRLRRIGRSSAEQVAEQKAEPQDAEHSDAAQNGANGVAGADHIDQADHAEAHEHTNGVAQMEMAEGTQEAPAAPEMELAEGTEQMPAAPDAEMAEGIRQAPAAADAETAEEGVVALPDDTTSTDTFAAGEGDVLADMAPEAFVDEALVTEAPEAVADPDAQPAAEEEQMVAEPTAEGEGARTGPAQTVPLASAAAEREELTPLPANAVVTGKYIVQSQLHQSQERNLYRVAPRRQQKCGTCGRLSSIDAAHCEHCGTALQKEAPAEFYLMAESFSPDSLMQDSAVMDLQLYHPNLVPVVDFFNYTPFGKTRYYAVAEPRQGVRLSQMSLPRPPMQVFGWAIQLADALNYLHTRGVVGAGAEADDILVQGDMASLASLQNARVSLEESPERTQMQSIDLAKLASTIFEAYTGFPAAMTPEGVLPMPAQAPEKVGAAFRAAIEPVQGIAPAISAAQWRDQLTGALIAITELEQPGRPVEFQAASMTDVGSVRDQNQDSCSSVEFVQASVEHPMRIGLYVVADGMGGHKGGEIASAIAAQVFTAEVMARVVAPLAAGAGPRPTMTNDAIMQGMARAVQTANDRIFKARDNRQNDMGTTLVAALVAYGKAYIINVGDSRLYMYARQPKTPGEGTGADGTAPLAASAEPTKKADQGTSPLKKKTKKLNGTQEREPDTGGLPAEDETLGDFALTQVSVDHSLVHRLVELGQLDPEEAKVHPHRNFIYRSLGGPPPIDVDTFVRTLHPGDRILVCSDGLNSMIEDEAIAGVLASEKDPNEAARKLIELANQAGGHDNITTILVDITDYLPMPEHPQAMINT